MSDERLTTAQPEGDLPSGAILLPPRSGRQYAMGALHAVFKADEAETAERYSVSEWLLDPHTEGPGAHAHDANDEIFYGIEGTASIRIGENWFDVTPGTFVRIPAGTLHDFANRTDQPAGLLNLFIPGGFERNMPTIVRWFRENR